MGGKRGPGYGHFVSRRGGNQPGASVEIRWFVVVGCLPGCGMAWLRLRGWARMGGQGDRTRRRQAGSGQGVQLTPEVVFRMACEGTGSGHEPDGEDAGGRQPEATELRRDTKPAAPRWPAVIATTVRLWLRRNSARLGRFVRRRWVGVLAVLAVMVLAAGGLTVALTRHAVSTAPAAGDKAAGAGAVAGRTGQNSGALAAGQAAAWVAQQVSRDAVVACDPSTCPVLQARGFPAENLLVLPSGAADPLFAGVIVATPAVRDMFGSRLQFGYAPAVIASFGSGAARIDVRAIAPDGAAAYRAALGSDWAARRSAAAELVSNRRVHAAGAARQALLSGQVDSRLLITLAALAVSHSVSVVAFGGSAPGASAGVPLREMDISGTGSAVDRSAELQRMRSFVFAQHPAFLPAHVSLVRVAGGGSALRIEFGAPSPLGLLAGRPVTQ
jgi:hypothetical protein